MTALLEEPAIRQRVARLSVEDYHRLGERPMELLRGVIIEKMSISPARQFHVDRLRKLLSGQISPEWLVRQEGLLTFADSEPEPDVAVVRGPEELYRTAHPAKAALVVEIALSSLEVDRLKAQIYADASVAEYWIVCPHEKQVEVYRQPGANGYGEHTVVTPPAAIECLALPGVRLDLAAIFA